MHWAMYMKWHTHDETIQMNDHMKHNQVFEDKYNKRQITSWAGISTLIKSRLIFSNNRSRIKGKAGLDKSIWSY